jgi:hydroxymethylpyrimidine/phosphomethylpyrimidine kinase
MTAKVPVALTIAGSDSGAGAGIQADLKTFAALEVYGVSAITAVTAQNTLGVIGAQELEPAMVAAQIDAVAVDLGVDAVKTGMLSSAPIIEVVAERLKALGLTRLVVDPVIAASSGERLLRADALDALRRMLLPLALVVTPNAAEAEALSGLRVRSLEEARTAAQAIAALGPRYVVVTGGHFGEEATDVLYDGTRFTTLSAQRIPTRSTHGTGCTYSSAITAGLSHGKPVDEAVHMAKEYVHGAIAAGFSLGAGHGPLNHFFRWWREDFQPDHGTGNPRNKAVNGQKG